MKKIKFEPLAPRKIGSQKEEKRKKKKEKRKKKKEKVKKKEN